MRIEVSNNQKIFMEAANPGETSKQDIYPVDFDQN